MKDRKKKHQFLRRVVRLCLVMMVLLTVSAVAHSWIFAIPIDPTVFVALMSGWCGELLLTLLKRKFEKKDKTDNIDISEPEEGEDHAEG